MGICLVTPLQLPVKQTQNINTNRHTFNKPFKCHCCRIFSSADNFKNSDNKTTRKCKSLKQYFFPIENGCASKPKDKNLTTIQSDLFKQLNAFYLFSRPHTVIGTLIGITSISILPLESTADLSLAFLVGLLKALVPSILMNLYVVGINQLFDVDIDKVNKPDLPLPSGEFSMEFGMAMVSTYLLMSFTMGIMFQSLPLFSALLVSFLLGSAYSVELPLLRWKRNAFLAAICILIVRAIIIQLAFFIHIQKYVLSRPVVFTESLVFAIGFTCLFSTIIALFKDIPDVDGDREFGIQSFSVSLGPEKVSKTKCFHFLITLLCFNGCQVMGGEGKIGIFQH
ncbi:homogentisate geranylgeranyltransferase-like [Camellia sinensis]|uniref:homogentisate geranylgeranyltransferase-like n=1 Tax=Camellia sinensis TaxID=4442 RepID=UPI001035E526|nr:homogentisate geranylgeranyltransferase-like [Camellia sinensis]